MDLPSGAFPGGTKTMTSLVTVTNTVYYDPASTTPAGGAALRVRAGPGAVAGAVGSDGLPIEV